MVETEARRNRERGQEKRKGKFSKQWVDSPAFVDLDDDERGDYTGTSFTPIHGPRISLSSITEPVCTSNAAEILLFGFLPIVIVTLLHLLLRLPEPSLKPFPQKKTFLLHRLTACAITVCSRASLLQTVRTRVSSLKKWAVLRSFLVNRLKWASFKALKPWMPRFGSTPSTQLPEAPASNPNLNAALPRATVFILSPERLEDDLRY
ncbi:hypothetical protein IE53DRAFT_288450 [Violaceomyces palustris]|uniref:Uncharacterized protein n=1 Tax=Violaceomyces palustris TaxID=1673888 RepID=A0ACD0NLY4_9BASI|nr:hypothetical protein IE53DRAFT_288450 [Violaceomyces palustris]